MKIKLKPSKVPEQVAKRKSLVQAEYLDLVGFERKSIMKAIELIKFKYNISETTIRRYLKAMQLPEEL